MAAADPVYYMLTCQSPRGMDRAILSYEPDRLPSGLSRGWHAGKRFATAPSEPIRIEIEDGESGVLLEYYDAAIPVLSRRLAKALQGAGVSNIDYYEAEIHDQQTGATHRTHLAFNIVGAAAVADLAKSKYNAPDGPLIAVDFDSLAIDPSKARGALLFRLAESVNGVVVHESVRRAVEGAGIDTLTFVTPAEWVG